MALRLGLVDRLHDSRPLHVSRYPRKHRRIEYVVIAARHFGVGIVVVHRRAVNLLVEPKIADVKYLVAQGDSKCIELHIVRVARRYPADIYARTVMNLVVAAAPAKEPMPRIVVILNQPALNLITKTTGDFDIHHRPVPLGDFERPIILADHVTLTRYDVGRYPLFEHRCDCASAAVDYDDRREVARLCTRPRPVDAARCVNSNVVFAILLRLFVHAPPAGSLRVRCVGDELDRSLGARKSENCH